MAATALLGGSCSTPHKPYWTEQPPPPSPNSAPLRVIEFDEHGDFWHRPQFKAAQAMLKSRSKPILITYVHGWRHDASRDDSNLQAFQTFLDTVNRGLGGRVCGVYVGWRGASVEEKLGRWTAPAAVMSFWGRKEITDSIAGVPLSASLWRLSELARESGGHSVIIGHSFGGRIVERALGQAIVSQMSTRQPMPYDLAFLINPAAESLYARQLKLALRNWKHSSPAIVVLAAEDDGATGRAWPIAMRWKNNAKSRDYDLGGLGTETQSSYVNTTVGNDRRQWTHHLAVGEAVAPPKDEPAVQNLRNAGSKEFLVQLNGTRKGEVAKCSLLPSTTQGTVNHVIYSKAYWVVPLKEFILSGHSGDDGGIFSPTMTDLMAGIVSSLRTTKVSPPDVPKLDLTTPPAVTQ